MLGSDIVTSITDYNNPPDMVSAMCNHHRSGYSFGNVIPPIGSARWAELQAWIEYNSNLNGDIGHMDCELTLGQPVDVS